MTGRWPGIAALCCLLAFGSSACEKGPAWVLWQRSSGGRAPPGEEGWVVIEGYRELAECRREAAAQALLRRQVQVKLAGEFAARSPEANDTPEHARASAEREVDAGITVSGGYFAMRTLSGTPMVFDHICLPGSVDPRGPTGK